MTWLDNKRFCERKTGDIFGVNEPMAPLIIARDQWRKVSHGKWHPPEEPTWTLDYNAERVNPKGDMWDKVYINSGYWTHRIGE